MTGPVAIQVGANVEAIKEARAAILEIMAVPCGGRTTRAALDSFVAVCKVSNVEIHDSTITMTVAPEAAVPEAVPA